MEQGGTLEIVLYTRKLDYPLNYGEFTGKFDMGPAISDLWEIQNWSRCQF